MFPIIPANSEAGETGNDEGIIGFGYVSGYVVTDITNLVSNTGVVASDVSGVGTASSYRAACEYGGDKGIFGYGTDVSGAFAVTNLVSNAGVVASDTVGVGTARPGSAACSYGGDKGIFGFSASPYTAITNLVSNTGVVSSDQAAATGTVRGYLGACEYGGDKGIFGYGRISGAPGALATTNLVSNTGVVASDTAGVGTARKEIKACWYGEDVKDKGIFGFGSLGDAPTHTRVGMTNLVSNVGVVATDTTAVGTARGGPGACEYGQDKAIFGFGNDGSMTAVSNLVSNVGVVATDTAGVGTARTNPAACSFN